MTKRYNLKNIRTLLTEGFDDEELRRLCYDEDQFRPVYDKLAQDSGKAKIIDLLIKYSEQKLLIDVLLDKAKQHNPARYKKHQPYDIITTATTSSGIHGKSKRASIIKVPDGSIGQARDLSWAESQESESRVLLVTVTPLETKAVLSATQNYKPIYDKNNTYYDLDIVGGVHLFLVRSGIGTIGSSGATVTISEAIAYLHPIAIVAAGIAFGVDPHRQKIGEILISDWVFSYGPQRVSTTPDNEPQRIPRGDEFRLLLAYLIASKTVKSIGLGPNSDLG